MSSVNPISVRIASKTRFFETAGDSSYYYSNHLLDNLALSKNINKLGQQLAWPVQVAKSAPAIQKASTFLSKAYQPVVSSRIPHVIDLNSMPGKQWLSANKKLVDYLSNSALFFNSRAIGLLSQALGRNKRFNAVCFSGDPVATDLIKGKNFITKSLTQQFAQPSNSLEKYMQTSYATNSEWYKSFNYFPQLAKYCNKRPNKQIYNTRLNDSELALKKCLQLIKKKHGLKKQINSIKSSNLQALTLKKKSKQFKTPVGLPFYLLALGLTSHSQVLRSSLTTVPVISGNLQSNLLLADHSKVIKLTGSGGLGLVSASPKSYISRSHKNTVLNYFFKLTNNFSSVEISQKQQNLKANSAQNISLYNKVFITADLQGLKQLKKNRQANYATVRWI